MMELAVASPITLVAAGVVAAVTLVLYRILVSPFRLLSSHGLKGPHPLPITGNYRRIKEIGHTAFLVEQIKKYGPVFGYYVGAYPNVTVADVELVKEIMVKRADIFRDRGLLGPPNFLPKALGISEGLVVATGDTWKTARHVLTPSFSALKMKLMVPIMKRSSDVLLEIVGEYAKSGKSVEVFKLYAAFSIEGLMAAAFGRYVNLQQGEADQLTEAAEVIFRAIKETSPQAPDMLIATLSNFPWLEPLVLHVIGSTDVAASAKLMYTIAVGLIEARIKSKEPPKVKDLLQLMLDATEESDSNKRLTSEQIAGFSVEFLLAGYETTATTLTYTTYLLAMNPDVQEKLQAEIDQFFEENPEASMYDASQKVKYLDMVIQESTRLYTPVPKCIRLCSKTVTIGGVTIPKGANVVIPIDFIHHMPEYWPDPYKFDPERFTPEAKANRPQLAHMPFGWGPRNCLGMRFALLEIKIALVEILKDFSFARAPETVANLEQLRGLTSPPKGGVFVKIVPRA